MAQFIALVQRDYDRFAVDDFTPLLDAEAQRVRALYTDSVVRQAYSRKDVAGAVLVLEAPNLDAAQAAVASLPLAQKGMVAYQIIELSPYRGFAPGA